MKQRCLNPNFRQWADYGGRGIAVCERWLKFENFYADMGDCPPGMRIERTNNDGNYEPTNCKWATPKEQQRNQRVTRRVTIEGASHVAADLAERSGLKTDTIVERAKQGLSLTEVLSPTRRVYKEGLSLGGKANGKRNLSKTHCPQGHEYSEGNTYVSSKGFRRCKRCRADRQLAYNKTRAA